MALKRGQLGFLLGSTIITSAGFALLLAVVGVWLSTVILRSVIVPFTSVVLVCLGLYLGYQWIKSGKLSAKSVDWGDAALTLALVTIFIFSGLIAWAMGSAGLPFAIG